jgi:hypothetical protein
MAFESYFKQHTGILEEVMKETHERHPNETDMLFEFIDNWPDFISIFKDKEKFLQATNSLSGIILINSWKLTNWISYEILTGKYFEAIRNLRFVFEGSVYALILENAIERAVFEKWGTLSTLDLKSEIFELWEECNRKKVCKKGAVDRDRVKELVVNFIDRKMDPSKSKDMRQYTEVYTRILCTEELYLPTGRMVEACSAFLRLGEEDTQKLTELWHELSRYQHFSYRYLEALIDDPDFLLLEKTNGDLLKRSVTLYFETLDFSYAVLAWRFAYLRKQVREMCDWWTRNFGKTFSLTVKTLRNFPE